MTVTRLLAFLVVVLGFGAAAASQARGERSLERCLEVLSRDDDGARQGQFCGGLAPAPAGYKVGRNEPGLVNDDFIRNGFQGETSPLDAASPPKHYEASHGGLAIQSPACASMQDPSARCLNYFEVDAYIALDDDISADEIGSFSAIHPWRKMAAYSDRVLTRRVRAFDELKQYIKDLTQDCYLFRHVLISSHGAQRRLYIKEAKKTQDWMPMSWIFSHSGLMCALAPEARVQFDGCNVACRDGVSNGAEDLLSQLNSLAGNSRYATPANATPFDKTRFLFNTSRGRAADSFRNFFLRKGWNYNIGIRDEENSAIMYSVKGNTVETDVPTANAALCPVEKP